MSSAVSKLELQKLELEQELTDSVAMFDYESSVRIEDGVPARVLEISTQLSGSTVVFARPASPAWHSWCVVAFDLAGLPPRSSWSLVFFVLD